VVTSSKGGGEEIQERNITNTLPTRHWRKIKKKNHLSVKGGQSCGRARRSHKSQRAERESHLARFRGARSRLEATTSEEGGKRQKDESVTTKMSRMSSKVGNSNHKVQHLSLKRRVGEGGGFDKT